MLTTRKTSNLESLSTLLISILNSGDEVRMTSRAARLSTLCEVFENSSNSTQKQQLYNQELTLRAYLIKTCRYTLPQYIVDTIAARVSSQKVVLEFGAEINNLYIATRYYQKYVDYNAFLYYLISEMASNTEPNTVSSFLSDANTALNNVTNWQHNFMPVEFYINPKIIVHFTYILELSNNIANLNVIQVNNMALVLDSDNMIRVRVRDESGRFSHGNLINLIFNKI